MFRYVVGGKDLRLELSGHDAVDTGLDLSATFSIDVGGETRPMDAGWDIGADEAALVRPKITGWQEVDPYP